MDILSSLGIIHERINKLLQEELKQSGISMSCGHIWLLSLVYRNGGSIEIRDLVKTLEKKKTTISEMVSTLERKGFLIKFQSMDDKRIFCVKTTGKADEIEEEVMKVIHIISAKIMKDISVENISMTEETMSKMAQNIK